MDNGSPHLTPGVRKRVFISYSRLEPDERVAEQLYESLRGSHDVFYDRLIEPGEVWSQRIEQELHAADYFVVLLSEKSIAQEGVQGEIEIACEMSKQNAGKPIVIPVRVRYDKRLPYDLFMRLRRIQHFNWSDDADTRLIADRLRSTMQAGVAPGTPVDQAPAAPPERAQPADADQDMRSPDSNIFAVEQVIPLEIKGESDDERREKQIAAFYDEAQAGMAAEDWAVAIEKLQAILSLDPAHVEVEEKLAEAQQQQKLSTLYNLGRKLFEEGSWGKALDAFHELQERAGDYEDISALITTAEGELARKQVVAAPTHTPEYRTGRVATSLAWPLPAATVVITVALAIAAVLVPAIVLGIVTAGVTHQQLEELQTVARAALQEAKRGATEAKAADQGVAQARISAEGAQACCNENSDKLDELLGKAMKKE